MHIEIQVALNFVISYLYNKLPRRRVNIFGEELEKALKEKFEGHWYPEKPFKGSAYRCLKVGDPVDPVIDRAAHESGVPTADVVENLPQELAVWVDPGEVSYRIGEKGTVKILYQEATEVPEEQLDKEVTKTFNPEAQCFRPIESLSSSLSNLSLSPKSPSPYASNSPTPPYKSTSPINAFVPRSAQPLTFTTATFAQTKFGSTKLKTSSKRANRMSPTEFSNYIKQRAMQQQIQQQQQQQNFVSQGYAHQQRPRSLSPNPQLQDPFFYQQNQPQFSQFSRSLFDNSQTYMGDIFTPTSQQSKFPFVDTSMGQQFYGNTAVPTQTMPSGNVSLNTDNKQLLEGLNFGLGTMAYPGNQYQRVLVAN